MASIRLNKLISEAGLCSRRKAESWIIQGLVTVNGKVVTELGSKANPSCDRIFVNGTALARPERKQLVAFYKPRRVVVTRDDPEGRNTVYDLLPPHLQSFKYIGRLDYDSEGLLLLTNDGDLAQHIAHPRHHLDKRYLVTVSPPPTPTQLERLKTGAGDYAPIHITLRMQANKKAELELILGEGRNRQIRRMCEAVGLTVKRLKRVAIGPIALGSLAPGKWRQVAVDLIHN